jgi:hypothetical protein
MALSEALADLWELLGMIHWLQAYLSAYKNVWVNAKIIDRILFSIPFYRNCRENVPQ